MCSTVLNYVFCIVRICIVLQPSQLPCCFFSESLKSTLHCSHEVHIHIQYPATLQLFIKHTVSLRNSKRYWYV
ncbi:hypothetical protein XELAEV_18007406mg [Xenopus laevis]|uniref:Secreted protein n=1 Tax=Xenopus laevis TaxID=8355 RepID=A0A974I563_XENLA|nr:hypothetical protein XELAEV_18007406mg [Xenopus laevis]